MSKFRPSSKLSLRQPATDKLKRDYNTLKTMCEEDCKAQHANARSPLHQMSSNDMEQCVEQCMEEIIGTEAEFRSKMDEDAKYKKLVELVGRRLFTDNSPLVHL